MKKVLLTLLALVSAFGIVSAETYTIEFKANASSGNNGPIISDKTDINTVVTSGAEYIESLSDFSQAYAACNYGFKIGANKQAGKVTLNLSANGIVNASKVEVYASASKNATYQKLKVNGTEFSFTSDEVNGTFKVCEIAPSGTLETIVLEKTNASTVTKEQGFVFVNKIVVTYEAAGPVLPSSEISFPQSAYVLTLGEAFEAPVATVTEGDGAVTYASSDEAVATVDANTGVVTVVAAGTTKITATVAATETYAKATASYDLTVVDPNAPIVIYSSALGEDFTFDQNETYPWSHDATYGLKGSAYVNKTTNASEGIAWSPVIDLTMMQEVNLNFQTAFNQYKINNNLIDPANFNGYAYIVAREEGDTDYIVLEEMAAPASFSWNFYDYNALLAKCEGAKVQIGFKYVSTAECAGTWEIKEIKVTGKPATEAKNYTATVNFTNEAASYGGEAYNVFSASVAVTGDEAANFDVYYDGKKIGTADQQSFDNLHFDHSKFIVKHGEKVVETAYNGTIDLAVAPVLSKVVYAADQTDNEILNGHYYFTAPENAPSHHVEYLDGTNWNRLGWTKEGAELIIPDVARNNGDNAVESKDFKVRLVFPFDVHNNFAPARVNNMDPEHTLVYAEAAPATFNTQEVAATTPVEGNVSGIEDITVDNAGAVEYYNLQGVRVANPENGLYIRRQGNTATKVYVK